jgi:hypothetical protein
VCERLGLPGRTSRFRGSIRRHPRGAGMRTGISPRTVRAVPAE